jgi:predicted RNase H-like HicB family nuclease
MVVPAGQPRRVLHYQAAVVPDGDGGFAARCLELGWLCAHGRTVEQAMARLRDLVEMAGGLYST